MAINVVLTAAAENDLARIADYIATDSPTRAVVFLNELRQCCEGLAAAPHGYPLVPRYAHLAVRRRVYQAYLVFYRVSSEQIEVLHIVHGRRDLDALLLLDQRPD